MDMETVRFYRGMCGNQRAKTLEEMLTWSDGQLEMDHDYVQWMFPSNQRSMLNGEAPVLDEAEAVEFQNDPKLQAKVKECFVRFLAFLGLKLVEDGEKVVIDWQEPGERHKNPQWWIGEFNHNMLRVTRVLKSLALTGLTRYAVALYSCLMGVKDRVSQNVWGHWTRAVVDPLW